MSDPITKPPVVTRANTQGVAKTTTDSPEEIGFISAFRRLLKKHENAPDDAQEHALGGKTREQKLMSVVDDAVTGAKGANPDY